MQGLFINRFDGFAQDVRYAVRALRRNPGFATVAVLSLALGIGANTAIFSLISVLMFRALPVSHPEQLVEFLNQYPGDPSLNAFSQQSYEHFRDHNHVFSGVTGERLVRYRVRSEGLQPEVVYGESVLGNFFEVLGVTPAIGHLIASPDGRAGKTDSAVAVVSWSYWKDKLHMDPAILGRQMVLDSVPVTIIGVAPRTFFGLRVGLNPDIWVPLALDAAIHHENGGLGALSLIGRLKPGVSLEQSRAEMAVLFRWTLEERSRGSRDPLMRRLKFEVQPASAGLSTGLRDQFAKPLLALMALVGLVLLMTCANLANLLLARGVARQTGMAIRASLGASRFRLMSQVLCEALLLAAAGTIPGILLAFAGADALVRIMASGRPIIGMPRIEIRIYPDQRVLLFAIGVALLTGLLFGLTPAWNAFRSGLAPLLGQSGRASETRFRRLSGKSLVVAQVAFSMVLLSAAGLFVGHLWNLENIDLGFRRDHVLLVSLDPAQSGYNDEQLSAAYQELLGRLEALPGVRSASISAPTPLSGAAAPRFASVEGHPEPPGDRRYLFLAGVAPRYFETVGTPLLTGRDFRFSDRGGMRVAIVNLAMARYYFPLGNPVGKHLTFDRESQPYEIVGVASDAKYSEIHAEAPRTVYLNTFQFPHPASDFMIRTGVDPRSVDPAVRRTINALLKTVPVVRVTTLDDQVNASIVPERLIATLSGLFGALGSLLAAIGLGGLLAYTVARRVHEIGVRMALGATRGAVSRMVLREALAMTCGGLAIGVLAAYWGERFAGSLIPGLQAGSVLPIAFGAASSILIALIAAYVPAYRAARVDPMEALRYE